MNALILAAGYGTRLEQDLRTSEDYHQLLGVPKPLLPIGDRPLVSHWMSILQSCIEIRDVYMVVSRPASLRASYLRLLLSLLVLHCIVIMQHVTINQLYGGGASCTVVSIGTTISLTIIFIIVWNTRIQGKTKNTRIIILNF